MLFEVLVVASRCSKLLWNLLGARFRPLTPGPVRPPRQVKGVKDAGFLKGQPVWEANGALRVDLTHETLSAAALRWPSTEALSV